MLRMENGRFKRNFLIIKIKENTILADLEGDAIDQMVGASNNSHISFKHIRS